MIELYDASRLETRRDPVLLWAPLVAVAALAGYGSFAWSMHGRTQRAEAELALLKSRLPEPAATASAPDAASKAGATLLADLQRRAEAAEAAAEPVHAVPGPAPSHWMALLDQLGRNDASFDKVEIDRAGQVRLDGRAAGAPAVAAVVQAWDRLHDVAALGPRAVELREDKAIAPHLRFRLQASLRSSGAGAPR